MTAPPAGALAPDTIRAGGCHCGRYPGRISLGNPPVGETAAPALRTGQERFVAYAVHELRTPLSTQRALLELALADPSADVASWREIGTEVLDACRQQERLLEACLSLARSHGSLPRCEPLDLAAIAAQALRAHDLGELASRVELEPARTSGDPSLVERLVANLVSNAIRHNIAGGRIEIATRGEPGRALLSVANTGPVIPAGELPRLFQPFQRLASDPTGAARGLGLGLAIVEAIADAHGATVSARAGVGGGLEVQVAFPRPAAAGPA